MALKQTMGFLKESSPRAAEWKTIFGGLEVPLKSPLPVNGFKPDGTPARFYMVDWVKLKQEVLNRAIGFVAAKFNMPHAEVIETLKSEHGFPILEEDVNVSFDARLVL